MNWYKYLETALDNNRGYRKWVSLGFLEDREVRLTKASYMLDDGLYWCERRSDIMEQRMIDFIYEMRCAEYERKLEAMNDD